jgi:hypothetical protein
MIAEDWIQVNMNLGSGDKCYFRGKIKTLNHVGENSAEEIAYTAQGIPNLADEIEILGPYGDGYVVSDVTTPGTMSFNGAIIPAALAEPRHLRDAVDGLFAAMAPELNSHGISANRDITGISTLVVVDGADTRISGGFFNALKELVSRDPGVKPWFDDTDETWKFVRAIDSDVLSIKVQDVPLLPHQWEEDTTDRYTAIILYPNSQGEQTRVPVVTYDLEKGWDESLEGIWSHKAATKDDAELGEDITELQKVYREWILTQRVGVVPSGTKSKLHYKVPARLGAKWAEVGAEIIVPHPTGAIFLNPGQKIPRPYAIIRTTHPVVIAGNPYIAGHARGPRRGTVAATYFVPEQVANVFAIRYPENGFEGTAYTKAGIARVKYLQVPEAEVYVQNAAALLRIYKDIKITCNLPIYGDPIERLLRLLDGRINLSHVTNKTGLENAKAVIAGYRYEFRESTGTIQMTTDIANFIRRASTNG